MSEEDLDDILLELAGQGENKKRKRRHGSSSNPTKQSSSSSLKKRKAEIGSDSDKEAESEEGEPDPYPVDGKFVDEADRQRLMQMSEIEREEILAQRLEEKQRLLDRRAVSQMVKEQRGGDALDAVAKAAKRQHAQRGATKEKSKKLDELKARRKAKGEKQRSKNHSPKRDRSSSPMDMEISDDESEDGQITKLEQEEEKERRLFMKIAVPDDEPATMADLERCRLSRDSLAKYCLAPWFEDYVQHAWVRYLIGQENNQPVYRICEIANLAADLVKPYKVNDKTVDQAFDLKHGKSLKSFLMDKVSNSAFQPKEFERLVKVCAAEEVKLPSKQTLEKKVAQLHKLSTQPITENDISAMLRRKNEMQLKKPTGLSTIERSRLNQARTLAFRRHDFAEVKEIDEKLAAYGPDVSSRDENPDMLAKVNERNRKANLEAVRKAEIMEAERKRRERKLAASGGSGALTPSDPSARLKTLPRLFNANTPSRPGTPNPAGTPLLQPQTSGSRPVSPLPPPALSEQLNPGGKKSFIESIEVDLGDF